MKCPACNFSLHQLMAGDIEIEYCRDGCGGIWFDWKELKKFDEPHEFLPPEVLRPSAGAGKVDSNALRTCPKCSEKETLCRRYFDIQNQVEVDQCLECSGIWLDTREIETIRSQYPNEAARNAAGDAWLQIHLDAAKVAIDGQVMDDLDIDRARLERYKQPGIEPSTLTRILRSILMR